LNEERHSEAQEAEIISDPDLKAAREARNALSQFDLVVETIEEWTQAGRPRFNLRPSLILGLHRSALHGISSYAGVFRPAGIEIMGSKHVPIGAHRVAEAVEELCDYVNQNWETRSAIHLSAQVLWRMNWIHPFTDGNGRTARAVAYLVLCVRLGYRLPGVNTIPEQISRDKTPYYEALEKADAGAIDAMETLLSNLLTNQLAAVIRAAAGDAPEGTPTSLH
jgi:Fic family protein